MKTPEEIKKGLECCCSRGSRECPYSCGTSCDYCYENQDGPLDLMCDALAYIQQLEAQMPKWISVKDRLPSERVSVAVYINDGNGAYWIQTSYLNGGKWRIPGEYVVDRNITHWMPMPEPPKEETGHV